MLDQAGHVQLWFVIVQEILCHLLNQLSPKLPAIRYLLLLLKGNKNFDQVVIIHLFPSCCFAFLCVVLTSSYPLFMETLQETKMCLKENIRVGLTLPFFFVVFVHSHTH